MKTELIMMVRSAVRRRERNAAASVARAVLMVLLVTANASASLILSEEGISPTRSAEYVRTQSRNASTEADAVHYNPAGLSFMQNGGIYIMVNSVNVYTHTGDSIGMWGAQGVNSFNRLISPMQSRYQSVGRYLSTMALAMPTNVSFIFRRDNWAVFADVSAFRGQPGATYTQGASSLDRLLVAYNTVLASRFSQELAGV
ncbi:MAG: hypothetical protein E4G96_08620, partial [Chrysiogenales bacterium]